MLEQEHARSLFVVQRQVHGERKSERAHHRRVQAAFRRADEARELERLYREFAKRDSREDADLWRWRHRLMVQDITERRWRAHVASLNKHGSHYFAE